MARNKIMEFGSLGYRNAETAARNNPEFLPFFGYCYQCGDKFKKGDKIATRRSHQTYYYHLECWEALHY